MAQLKSVSGFVLYVYDLDKTAAFYETLGFITKKRDATQLSVNMNWFWIDFLLVSAEDKPSFKEEAALANKGSGVYFYLSVDDVDGYHAKLVEAGYKPSSEPKDQPWGNREFVIRDPDGYKLVAFKRK